MKHLLPFLSALLLWLAFPPADLGFLGWIALAPLVAYALTEARGRRAFFVAWAAGTLFHTVAFSWVWYTAPYVGPPSIGVYMGLYWAVFAALIRWACATGTKRLPVTLAAPVAWVALEFLRSYLFTGLPFWVVGYSMHRMDALIQIADLGGVYLVTFLVVLVNAVVARAFTIPAANREYRWSAAASMAAIVLSLVYGAVRVGTIRLEDGMKIGIVQPNIPQDIKNLAKEDGDTLDRERRRLEIYRQHMEGTRRVALEKPDLIVWPEAALLGGLLERGGRWIEDEHFRLAQSASLETRIPTVVGVLVVEAPPDEPLTKQALEERSTFTNSALYFSSDGRVRGRFDKIKLVPFAETMLFGDILPVSEWVARFLNTPKVFEFRRGRELPVFDHPKGRFGVSICSENYYPEISRELAGKGAGVIVNISNDGWFKESAELDAMLAMARFRAIENRVLYVRATNTGISALIEPTGRIAAAIEGPGGNRKSVAGTLAAVARVTRAGSPYRALGDWAAWLCAGLACGGLAALKWARRRGKVDSVGSDP